jgi:hypothetical protein
LRLRELDDAAGLSNGGDRHEQDSYVQEFAAVEDDLGAPEE